MVRKNIQVCYIYVLYFYLNIFINYTRYIFAVNIYAWLAIYPDKASSFVVSGPAKSIQVICLGFVVFPTSV